MADAVNATSGDQQERPVGELVKELSSPPRWCARRSSSRAPSCSRRASWPARSAGMLGGAAIAALLALGALSAGLVALLDTAIATWIRA